MNIQAKCLWILRSLSVEEDGTWAAALTCFAGAFQDTSALDALYCLWWVCRDRKSHSIVMPNERKWWYFCALSLFCKNL